MRNAQYSNKQIFKYPMKFVYVIRVLFLDVDLLNHTKLSKWMYLKGARFRYFFMAWSNVDFCNKS